MSQSDILMCGNVTSEIRIRCGVIVIQQVANYIGDVHCSNARIVIHRALPQTQSEARAHGPHPNAAHTKIFK